MLLGGVESAGGLFREERAYLLDHTGQQWKVGPELSGVSTSPSTSRESEGRNFENESGGCVIFLFRLWKGYFTPSAMRVKTLLNGGLKKRGSKCKTPVQCRTPGIDEKTGQMERTMGYGGKETIFAAAVPGFIFILRVSELPLVQLSDISIQPSKNGNLIVLVIRRSKMDQEAQ